MIDYFPIEFSSLNEARIRSYQSWVIPSVIKLLFDQSAKKMPLIGIEAHFNYQLVGFALARYFEENQTAQFYSIFVDLDYRKQGIGTHLFLKMEEFIKNKFPCIAIGMEYPINEFSSYVDGILKKNHWPPGRYYLLKCHFISNQFNPEWYQLQKQKALPEGFEIFLWENLTAQEKKRIAFEESQGMFLNYLSPLRIEKNIETLNSLGLRYKNKVIGWCLTQKIEPDTIRYSILYIEKEFHLLGYAIRLLAESIKLQKQSSKIFPKALLEVNYDEVDRSWWLFVNKKLVPFAAYVEKMKWALQAY